MASIDGQWESVAKSPMGDQRSDMILAGDGEGFSGTSTGTNGEAKVTDGKVTGDQVTYKIHMTMPFPMTLTVNGTLKGDVIDGTVDTGAFGSFPMVATRKS